MGSHCIDLLEMFFGPVKRVSCFVNRTVHPYESEDSAVASLFFENGSMGTVDAFFCIPDSSSENRLELYGSKGSILCSGTIGQGGTGRMVARLGDNAEVYDAGQATERPEGIVIDVPPVNPYMAEIEEFSSAILEGRAPSNAGGLGLRNQVILAACYESALRGEIQEV